MGKLIDLLHGGKSDRIPPSAFPPKKVEQGAKVESEHTSNKTLAREIARDHLSEDMDYYEKLRKMEKQASFQASIASFGMELEKLAKEEKEPFLKRHKGKLIAGAAAAGAVGVGAYLKKKGLITFKSLKGTRPPAAPKSSAPAAASHSSSHSPTVTPIKPAKAPSPKPPKVPTPSPAATPSQDHNRLVPHAPKLKPKRRGTYVYGEENIPGGLKVHPKPVESGPRLDKALLAGRYEKSRVRPKEVETAMDNLFEGVPKRNALQARLHAAKKPQVIIRKKDGTVKKASAMMYALSHLAYELG